ncbi:hypothetical protein ACFPRL_32060 [Pseudoclavibacter helvolus]
MTLRVRRVANATDASRAAVCDLQHADVGGVAIDLDKTHERGVLVGAVSD